jgi:uncharacterized protein YegP (UPF0339 family)
MPTNPKHKPGIHLLKSYYWRPVKKGDKYVEGKPEWYWNVVASNGRIIARSSETYTRKGNAVKSMKAAARVFHNTKMYYDHSKPNLEPQSYL